MLQYSLLLRYSSYNSVLRRVYWLLEKLLLNTCYEDKRVNNLNDGFELIVIT